MRIAWEVCEFHFFIFCLFFLASFFHLVFRFVECAWFISNNSIWEPQGGFMALPGGSPGSASRAVLHCKNNAFCIFSLKIYEKSFVFYCVILGASVAHSYQITLFARRQCFARGVPWGLPKKAFEQPKFASWASGAPLGFRGFFGDHLWISLVASSIWGALRGSLGMHLGLRSVFFSNLLAASGSILSKSSGITFVLQTHVYLQI